MQQQAPAGTTVRGAGTRWIRCGVPLFLAVALLALSLGVSAPRPAPVAAMGTDIGGNSAPSPIGCIYCDGHSRELPPQANGLVYVGCTPANFLPGCGETLALRSVPVGTLRNLQISQSGAQGGYNNYGVVVYRPGTGRVNTDLRCNVYPAYGGGPYPGGPTCSDLADTFVLQAGDQVELAIGDPGSYFNPGTFTVNWSLELDPALVDTDLGIGTNSNLTVNATSSSGAVVSYTAPSASDEDGPVTVSCSPGSGSTFAIGTATVICTASDADDAPSAVFSSFTVTVRGAVPQLTDLLAVVTGSGPGSSLQDKVQQVLTEVVARDTADACGTLQAFLHEVQAQTRKTLNAAQASLLMAAAQQIRAVLGC